MEVPEKYIPYIKKAMDDLNKCMIYNFDFSYNFLDVILTNYMINSYDICYLGFRNLMTNDHPILRVVIKMESEEDDSTILLDTNFDKLLEKYQKISLEDWKTVRRKNICSNKKEDYTDPNPSDRFKKSDENIPLYKQVTLPIGFKLIFNKKECDYKDKCRMKKCGLCIYNHTRDNIKPKSINCIFGKDCNNQKDCPYNHENYNNEEGCINELNKTINMYNKNIDFLK